MIDKYSGRAQITPTKKDEVARQMWWLLYGRNTL